jgi:hypothetical protein
MVSLSSGTTVLDDGLSRELRVLADARVIRLIGRTWTGSAGYHRGVDYLPALFTFLSSGTLNATIGGLWSPRMRTSFSTSYSTGFLASDPRQTLRTFTGVGQAQYALSKRVALEGRYLYYHYQFDSRVPLPPGVGLALTRNSVQAGISFQLPFRQ